MKFYQDLIFNDVDDHVHDDNDHDDVDCVFQVTTSCYAPSVLALGGCSKISSISHDGCRFSYSVISGQSGLPDIPGVCGFQTQAISLVCKSKRHL